MIEAFGIFGPCGLDLFEGHGSPFFEAGGERFEAVEAVFDGSHGDLSWGLRFEVERVRRSGERGGQRGVMRD